MRASLLIIVALCGVGAQFAVSSNAAAGQVTVERTYGPPFYPVPYPFIQRSTLDATYDAWWIYFLQNYGLSPYGPYGVCGAYGRQDYTNGETTSYFGAYWVNTPGVCYGGNEIRGNLGCTAGYSYSGGVCVPNGAPVEAKNVGCSRAESAVGNPCNAANGNKYHTTTDASGGQGVPALRRFYNSQFSGNVGFGVGWTSSVHRRLEIKGTTAQVRSEAGRAMPFACPSGTGSCSGDTDTVFGLAKGASAYLLTLRDGSVESYNTSGALQSVTDPAGLVTTYAYSSGRLATVTGPYGHTITFAYTSSGSRLLTATTSGGAVYQYIYDENAHNLVRVNYPGGTAEIYHYENTAFRHHLTGISHVEVGGATTRYSTFTYGTDGKATRTEHAGGVERFDLAYDSATQTTVTDASGTQEVLTFATNLGVKNLVSRVNQTDGKSTAQTFDADNNLTCRKDAEGRVTTYTYNSSNQRTGMTEGRTGTCASPTSTSATRSVSYQYVSSTLDLPTLVTAPSVHGSGSKTTELVYGDTSHPRLPTEIIESGYTPTGTATSRTVTLAYTGGRLTSVDGPRTDLSDVTELTYYSCTTGSSCGQIHAVENALGHVTSYDSYNARGLVTQLTDANNVVTEYAYDSRDRLLSVEETPPSGPSRTTAFTYNAAGSVLTVTRPNGHVLTATYNAAELLTSVWA